MSRSCIKKLIRRLWKGEEAATATEYAVMLAMIIATAISAIQIFGTSLHTMFVNIESSLFAA